MAGVNQISMTPADWINTRWEKGETQWHKSQVHRYLETYFDSRVKPNDGLCSTFVPLCGKSIDMIWLANHACSVVGVECSEKGVKEFFEDNKIEYKKTGNLYKGNSISIELLCDDLFNVNPSKMKTFDFIWDRGSFVAINIEDRKRYLDLMAKLLSPSGKMLLSTVDYTPLVWPGPPHYVKNDQFEILISGSPFTCELLESTDAMNETYRERWGVETFTETAYLLTFKK